MTKFNEILNKIREQADNLRGTNITYFQRLEALALFKQIDQTILIPASTLNKPKTTAGRVEFAEQEMQAGRVNTPEQYFAIINGETDETKTTV